MTPFNLPLFPLNTVLFPGMPLQLHIFEERYKQMINRCIQEGQPFGVVLIRKGLEAQGPLAEPYATGTTARITQVQKLSQGRMNILTVGSERFRVLQFDDVTRPYLAGSVDLFPLQAQERVAETASANLRGLFLEYLENLARISDISFDAGQIPVQPVELSYLTAVALQIPETNKQEILEVASAPELVEFLQARLRRELALLDVLAEKRKMNTIGSFSAN
jgi:Lon protease-like protein